LRRIMNTNEMAGTYAVVGCGDSPNFQVWGARSDLKCKKKKKDRMLKMSFKDWIEGGKDGRQED
jgi:hypothetical protein